jgi:hypothetical protein
MAGMCIAGNRLDMQKERLINDPMQPVHFEGQAKKSTVRTFIEIMASIE